MESVSHGHTIELVTDLNLELYSDELQTLFSGCTVKMGTDHTVSIVSEAIPLLPVLNI